MITKCSKPQAATRQLDVAIDLLFADFDPLAIRTLAAASHGILADLVERKQPGASWRSRIIQDSGLTEKDAISMLNNTQNYLKHADRDPDAELTLDEEENDHIMFVATLECGELGFPLSLNMQAYQIWYLASYPDKIGTDTDAVRKSRKVFPQLETLSRVTRLDKGAEFLDKLKHHDESL